MNEGSVVRWFKLGNDIYQHLIFCNEDDRIELQKNDGEVILTFDFSMNVFDADKKHIGKIGIKTLERFDYWVFETDDGAKNIVGGNTWKVESHIDLEVEVSKWYLKQYVMPKNEGVDDASKNNPRT